MSVNRGPTVYTLKQLETPNAAVPLFTPAWPGRRRLWLIGTSRVAGLSAGTDSPTGWRRGLFRELADMGVEVEAFGIRGLGGLAGTGTTWAAFENSSSSHRAYQISLPYASMSGHFGRRISATATITNVNTSTNTFSCSDQIFGDGSLVALIAPGGTLPVLTGAVAGHHTVTVQGVNYLLAWATNTINSGSTQTFQLSLTNSTLVAATTSGSGTITALAGIAELVLPESAAMGIDPLTFTDVTVSAVDNDVFNLVTIGASNILTTCETRATQLIANLDSVLAPTCRRRYLTSPLVTAPAANAAAVNAVMSPFNTWLTALPDRNRLWSCVDVAAHMTASDLLTVDGIHENAYGSRKVTLDLSQAIAASSGHGSKQAQRPARAFTRRAQTGGVLLSGTGHRITFANSALREFGGGGNCWAAWSFKPWELPSTLRFILQYTNPYSSGFAVGLTGNQFAVYMRSASPTLPISGYTSQAEKGEDHRGFLFLDMLAVPYPRTLLFINGNLVQEVQAITTAIATGGQLFLGGSGVSSLMMDVGDLAIGVNSVYRHWDAWHLAQADYWKAKLPGDMTERWPLDTNTASIISGAGAGTITSGAQFAAGVRVRRWEEGYEEQALFSLPFNITAATYTAVNREIVPIDMATVGAGGHTLTAPAATKNGDRFGFKETGNSANAITLVGTFDGVVNPVFTTANLGKLYRSINGAWRESG